MGEWLLFSTEALRVVERVGFDREDAPSRLAGALVDVAVPLAAGADGCVVVCLGTDRVAGDSLGPLVGTGLKPLRLPGFLVLGTLDRPVHAGNLAGTLLKAKEAFSRPLVIVVDACLGRPDRVGTVILAAGSLRPGAGVGKSLPPVGHVSLMGSVGAVDAVRFQSCDALWTARLSLVFGMARVISAALRAALPEVCGAIRLTRGGVPNGVRNA